MIKIDSFYDPDTGSFTHLVTDCDSKECAVIDPVLDFDIHSARISEHSVNRVIEKIVTEKLTLVWILETHAHADHLSAAQQLKQRCGGQVAIGENITAIQEVFKQRYGLDVNFPTNGEQFDRLLKAGECLALGDSEICVLATPGHTVDSSSYLIESNLFIGDTLFHPSIGTARCDFPGGDAEQLFLSIEKILSFDASTRLYLCHDYPPADREHVAFLSVLEMRENIHLQNAHNQLTEYVKIRTCRDQLLALPDLIIPAIQVNICAGILVDAKNDGVLFLKWPINVF